MESGATMKSSTPKRVPSKYFRYGLGAVALVAVVANLYVWFGPGRGSSGQTALELPSYPVEQVLRGREYYQVNCATCHGEDGSGYAREGVPAPALNGSMHSWHHPDSQIAGFIRHGVGQMPAVGAAWSDAQINAVLSYIKQWWEPEQLAYQTASSRQNP